MERVPHRFEGVAHTADEFGVAVLLNTGGEVANNLWLGSIKRAEDHRGLVMAVHLLRLYTPRGGCCVLEQFVCGHGFLSSAFQCSHGCFMPSPQEAHE